MPIRRVSTRPFANSLRLLAPDPVRQERLHDPVRAAVVLPEHLLLDEAADRPLDMGAGWKAVPRLVLARVEPRGLLREREHDQPLVARRVVPDLHEVVVLRAKHVRERLLDVRQVRPAAGWNELPDEVRKLLRRVGMPARRHEQAVGGLFGDRLVGLVEASLDERAKLRRLDHSDLDPLRAAPEGLVAVAEDALEHVPLAAEVDMPDLGL